MASRTPPSAGEGPPAGALLLAAGLAGAATMILELTATRSLAPHFGSSLHTWTNVIGVVLAAMAAGAWLSGSWTEEGLDAARLQRLLLVAAAAVAPALLLVRPIAIWLLPPPEALPPVHAAGHVVRGSLVVSGLCFAPPVFLLAMVSPWVIRLLVRRGAPVGRATGATLAAATLGSLLGTYLPAHVLIEGVGTRGSFLAAGVLLVAAALGLGRPSRTSALPLGLALMVLGGGGVLPVPLSRPLWRDPADPRRGEAQVLREQESAYQHLRLALWDRPPAPPQLRLALDEGLLEFHSVAPDATGLTGHYYDRFAVLPALVGSGEPFPVVVLGGGAGTMAHQFRLFHGARISRTDNVELDPQVLATHQDLGLRFGPLDRQVALDARDYLRRAQARFGLIVLDAYAHQIEIPFHLATLEFFGLARERLLDGGLFALNVSSGDLESPLVGSLAATLAEVFPWVGGSSVAGAWNSILLAGPARPALDANLWERIPPALRPVYEEFLRGLVEGDRLRRGGAILRDDRAPLSRLARKGGA